MTQILRIIGASSALVLMLSPVLGLLLASVVEVGPQEPPRASVVRWGLTLSDPFVGVCLGNSLATSGLAVAAATAVGVVMARIARSLGGWRRPAALGLVCLSAGVHPFFGALGYALIVPALGPLAASSQLEAGQGGWIALGLAQFAFASSWIAWWTSRALDRIRAEWLHVASCSGASRRRIWRTSAWPLVRPTVARAAASAFAVLLIEPGGPIVLGLRRTLGFQIVASAWTTSRPDWPRAATLAALSLAVAAVVRLLLIRWGGPDELTSAGPPITPVAGRPRPSGPISPSGRLRSSLSMAVLLAWLVLCLAPALAIFGRLAASVGDGNGPTLAEMLDRDGPMASPILGGLALGASASALAMLLAWPLSAFRPLRSAPAFAGFLPPLAIGVGLLGLCELLRQVAEGGPASAFPSTLSAASRAIDPYRSPWLLVTWGTALAHLPWAVGAARRARGIDAGALQDLARTAGVRRARSRTLLVAPIAARRWAPTALALALIAAAGLSPAIVLTPREPFRPLGSWIAQDPGLGAGPLDWLAAAGLLLQMLGVALLLRGGHGGEAEPVTVPRS